MVRFNMRSLAFMAFAVFAAASPVAETMNRQDLSAAAPVANYAPVQAMHPQFGKPEQEAIQQASIGAVHAQAMAVPQKEHAQDPSQAVRMVPCSESECLKSLSPEEQVQFRRQCEQMKLEQLKASAKGQSRMAKDLPQLTFYKMVTPQQTGANGVVSGEKAALGNRPNGKNLCCCCCCPCCCCCCPCCCCCKCCCCKCCCCCCPCCCC